MKFIRVAIGGQVIFSAAQQGKIGFLSQCRKYRETKKENIQNFTHDYLALVDLWAGQSNF